MRYKACKSCLWWWDLYDTGERMCYRKKSKFFHQQTVNGCAEHEDSIYERGTGRRIRQKRRIKK